MNKDGYTNNNGNKLIELCKMSDLKIANDRLGKDKGIGNYTCHTTNGNHTIDYALSSMEPFPYVDDFYVDILDKCMSDVHCPICLVMLCKPTVSIKNNNNNNNICLKSNIQTSSVDYAPRELTHACSRSETCSRSDTEACDMCYVF